MAFTFRRLNFFKGLFTSAEDWQAEQAYHIEKQRLHNAQLHIAGVVSGLQVTPAASGTGVQISAGHAIDPAGRHLHLDHDVQKEIRFDNYKQPTSLSVVLQYVEKECDKRQNPSNPEYTGNAFIEEAPDVLLLPEVPQDALALATIKVAPGSMRVRVPDDASDPKDNEIDTRVCQRAGAIGARASLKDAATVVVAEERQIGARKDSDARYHEDSVTWSADTDGHAFHFASVYPVDADGQVSWRLGCSRKGGQLQYTLFIRNHEARQMKVAYRVYRLD